MWVPKFHFVQHIPIHILLFGPCRLYMAFMFEGKNGVYSRAGERCNFKNPLLSMATRVEMRRAYELYAGLTRSYEMTFEGMVKEEVSPGDHVVVDLVLGSARRAEVTWLGTVHYNRKRMRAGSWVLLGGDVSRTLAEIKSLFQMDGILYVALHMYPALTLQAVEGYCHHVFAMSSYLLHCATVVVHVQPMTTLQMTLLHSRQHSASGTLRFITDF